MSTTVLCNLALSHIGVSKEIQNVETEQSKEAAACRRFREVARQKVLGDFAWPFANRIEALSLVTEDPNDEWLYEYGQPADCLKARRILSGIIPESEDTRVPFVESNGTSQTVIWTDKIDAQLEFTIDEDDTDRWPADFKLAYSYMLAMLLAPRLTAGDPFKLQGSVAKLYEVEISNAKKNAMNNQQKRQDPLPEMLRTRA